MSREHLVVTGAIYLVDALLIATVARWSVLNRRSRAPLQILLIGAVAGTVLAWLELWVAATDHAGYNVNGGIEAASAFTLYLAWRLPFGRFDRSVTRVAAAAISVGGQWALLLAVEEPWRLWH